MGRCQDSSRLLCARQKRNVGLGFEVACRKQRLVSIRRVFDRGVLIQTFGECGWRNFPENDG